MDQERELGSGQKQVEGLEWEKHEAKEAFAAEIKNIFKRINKEWEGCLLKALPNSTVIKMINAKVG